MLAKGEGKLFNTLTRLFCTLVEKTRRARVDNGNHFFKIPRLGEDCK
jgi:hypothetical protein